MGRGQPRSATSGSRSRRRAASGATTRTPEFNPDDPAAADGCIAHNDDFLQYYLGAYIYAAPGNTFDDEAGHPYALRGTGPFEGLSWMFDETGANNQDHSATFVVTSSVLPTRRSSRSSRPRAAWPTGCAPGAAPFSPYSGTQYMSAGADSQAYKRLGKTLDLTGRDHAQADLQVLRRRRAELGLRDRRSA